jgi:hypothetical protein
MGVLDPKPEELKVKEENPNHEIRFSSPTAIGHMAIIDDHFVKFLCGASGFIVIPRNALVTIVLNPISITHQELRFIGAGTELGKVKLNVSAAEEFLIWILENLQIKS